MDNHLDRTLRAISREFENKIDTTSRNYVEIDIGRRAGQLGFSDVKTQFSDVQAVIPLKEAQSGMKVRIDGRTFVNYGLLESGVAVPGYVLRKSKLAHSIFVPQDSMILNFA